ncbi:MAG: glutathione S-transferase family protein [Pseudomonadota bacterium]
MMKLYISPTSPYARKVRMVIIEKGLEDLVEEISLNPLDDGAVDVIPNPLCLVPTLERERGSALADSHLICAFLDSLSTRNPLVPDDDARWDVLHLQSLCDGMMDKAFSAVMERRRPEGERSEAWESRWLVGIDRTLDAIEEGWPNDEPAFDLGAISLISLLTYLDLRLPERAWRSSRPKLAAWLESKAARDSVTRTVYPS